MPTMTIKEVCAELHVSRRTVFRWIAEEKIKVIRLGSRTIRIEESEVERIKREGLR